MSVDFSFGIQLGTRLLDLLGRVEKKQEKIRSEHERMKTEKKAKDEALNLLSDFKKKEEELWSLLKSEGEETSRLKKANEENLEKLQAEQEVS